LAQSIGDEHAFSNCYRPYSAINRVELRADQWLSVHTIGGVITPGEVVMEIVPESDELQIEARLPPQEVDHVRNG
jgi:HlyD family secretion protein